MLRDGIDGRRAGSGWSALVLFAPASLLFATPARAAGLSGGLEAFQIIAIAAAAIFSVVAIVVFFVARRIATDDRSAETADAPPARPPFGLRVLALVQYVLAFGYGLSGFLTSIAPAEYENGRVAGWVTQAVLFRILFALGAVLSARGYATRSVRWGFKLGLWLGWLCIADFVLSYLLHGPNEAMIFGLPLTLFGVVLLVLLNFRYRPYFGAGERSAAYSMASRLFRGAGRATGALVVLTLLASLFVTTFFPRSRDGARDTLKAAAEGVYAYRDAHGDWPASLDQIDADIDRYYRWHRVEYVPEEKLLEMHLPIARKPNLLTRLSFDLVGGERIWKIQRQLRD